MLFRKHTWTLYFWQKVLHNFQNINTWINMGWCVLFMVNSFKESWLFHESWFVQMMNLGRDLWICPKIHWRCPKIRWVPHAFCRIISRDRFHLKLPHIMHAKNPNLVASWCNVFRVIFLIHVISTENAPRLTHKTLILFKFLCFAGVSCDQNQFKELIPCKLDMLLASIEDHVKVYKK